MLMLGFSAGFCVEPSEPKGHRPVRAAGTHARSSAALPRAICCQAYSLKSRVPVERGAGGGDWQPAK
jgi:hypothetical protein